MRIGIDARMYGKGFGLARYIEQLILHLEESDTKNEYIIFLRKENYDTFQPNNPKFKKVLADIPWYGFAEQIKLPALIKKEKIDVMHFPHFNVPLFYFASYVVTIHDLIMFHNFKHGATTRNPLVYWVKHMVLGILLKIITRRAKHVLVTSEFTKKDVHETLNVPLEKITVTYQAPFVSQNAATHGTQEVLQKYSITKPYIMYVGAAYPHKNLEGLLKAWELFEKKYGEKYQLVLVGKENFFYTKLKNTVLPHYKNVIYTGFVGDDDLAPLYKGSTLYVFPSLYEGFGLPPLEAMAQGIPVVSSNKSCLPEVLQDAALYFEPEKPEEMADTIYKGISDEAVRAELKEKAQRLLPRYSWEDLAHQTSHIYKMVEGD